jgi:hypothetical protein
MAFKISDDGESITCSDCGLTSYNRHDVVERYCGKCHKFHPYSDAFMVRAVPLIEAQLGSNKLTHEQREKLKDELTRMYQIPAERLY